MPTSSFFGASFFCATAGAGLAGLRSRSGAAKATALTAASTAAAVTMRRDVRFQNAIIKCSFAAEPERQLNNNAGDVAEICSLVKAAAAQDSGMAVIAHRGI